MISRSDWKAVHEDMIAEDRRTLGAPPTAEELLAYTRGELAPDEAERIRELLVAYPELAQALTEPFPEEDAKRGDADFLSDEQVAKNWASLQQRIHGTAADAARGVVSYRL